MWQNLISPHDPESSFFDRKHYMKKILALTLCLCALTVADVAQTSPEVRAKTFEKVWSTVNERFYDPTFGGVDWKAVHDKYLPIVSAAKSDGDFYDSVREMLALLKVSHLTAG